MCVCALGLRVEGRISTFHFAGLNVPFWVHTCAFHGSVRVAPRHMIIMSDTGPGPGPRFNIKTVFPNIRNPIINIKWLWDRLIFIMGIPQLVRHLYWSGPVTETALLKTSIKLTPFNNFQSTLFKHFHTIEHILTPNVFGGVKVFKKFTQIESKFAYTTQKRKCLHFDEIIITGCTGSCQSDNFQCSQWWKFRQNDDIFVSVKRNPIQFGILPPARQQAVTPRPMLIHVNEIRTNKTQCKIPGVKSPNISCVDSIKCQFNTLKCRYNAVQYCKILHK